MHVAVEMDDIRREGGGEVQQPVTRALDFRPRIVHPFEREGAFVQRDVRPPGRLRTLRRTRQRPHGGQRDFHPVRLQRAGEFERVGPHAADGVGGHQNASGHGGGAFIDDHISTRAFMNPSGRSSLSVRASSRRLRGKRWL